MKNRYLHEVEQNEIALRAEVERLTEICREALALCVCGCATHEDYGEDGESCGQDGHECIRASPAVAALVARLRQERDQARFDAGYETLVP